MKLRSVGFFKKHYGLSRDSIMRMVEKGILTEYRTIGNHRRIDVEEVEKFLSAKKTNIEREMNAVQQTSTKDV